MNKLLLILLTALAWVPAAMATDFTFAQAGIKISLPDGFALLARGEIDQLYMPTRGPGFVMGNAARTITISYDLKPHKLASLNLGQTLKAFETVFEQRVPGLVWKERKLIEHEKQQWLQLEFLSKTGGVDYYNIMLITPMKEQMLVLNLNSTVAEFPQAEPVLRAAMKSVALNVAVPEMVINPVPAPATAAAPDKKPASAGKKEKSAS